MLSVQVFGPGTLLKYRSRIFWVDARRTCRCEGAKAEKAELFPTDARRSLLIPWLCKATYAIGAPLWASGCRRNGHDRTPVALYYAFFPSDKAAGFNDASWRRSRVAARGAGAAARDASDWFDQRWGSRTRRLPSDRLSPWPK